MKITIMRNQLIAALCTAGKQDVRPYLNGVYIEATYNETRIVATDGTILSVQRADAKGDNEVNGVFTMIVPRAAVEKVKMNPGCKTVEINNDGGKWGLVDFTTRTGFDPIEGYFPAYRRIIPGRTSGEVAQFDPALIAAFAKAAKVLGATYKGLAQVAIAHNGFDTPGNIAQRSALVMLGDLKDYVGVIMPLEYAAPDTPPGWVLSYLEAQEDSLV